MRIVSAIAAALLYAGAALAQAAPGSTAATAPPGCFVAEGGVACRKPAERARDVFNVRDFGAVGTGAATPIGTRYGATLAALASYRTAAGATPFAWAINPAFGLTFSMAPSATSRTAAQTFTETLSSTFPTYSATVAVWQDPAHGNYALLPGMLVTGACLAAGTTVAAVGRDPAAPDYGTVTLSAAPASPCSARTRLTFTIAPEQLQARTLDWLGWQTAMAQAWLAAPGGHVHAPAGNYVVNGEIINAGGVTDPHLLAPVLLVSGDGASQTRITIPADLGRDFAVFQEATRGQFEGRNYFSASEYRDFRIIGPAYVRTNGMFPSGTASMGGMDGITLGAAAYVHDLSIENTRAALNVMSDHGIIDRVNAADNGYGLYFAPYTNTYGGWPCTLCSLSGNTVASVAVAATNQIDGAHFKDINTGFGPYGFWLEQTTANVRSSNGGGISNSVFDSVFVESAGNCFICGPHHNGQVSGTTFIAGVYLDVGAYPINRIPGSTPADAIDVDTFVGNTMIGTAWSPYRFLSDAIIRVAGNATGNLWINDTGFVFNSTAAVPPFKGTDVSHIENNRFVTAQGNGVFMWAEYNEIPAGTAVWDTGNSVLLPYQDGKPFGGITAAPARHSRVGVVTEGGGVENVVKADPGQAIGQGQPVFATAGGVAGGLDQTSAIGTAFGASAAGARTVRVDIDPTHKGGSPGIATGLTAAGTTQATAYPITASTSEFTTVASGAGALLGIVPVGSSVTLCNDGANPETVYPHVGGTIHGLSQNAGATLGAGSCASYRRLSATLWHQ